MSYSQWLKDNGELVDEVTSGLGQGQVPQKSMASYQQPGGQVQMEPARIEQPAQAGGKLNLKKILSLVGNIYSGGVSGTAQAAAGK